MQTADEVCCKRGENLLVQNRGVTFPSTFLQKDAHFFVCFQADIMLRDHNAEENDAALQLLK